MRLALHSSLTTTLRLSLLSPPSIRPISSTTHQPLPPPPPPPPSHPNRRTLTPHDRQFNSWLDNLKPGFTPSDVDAALKSQPDPDLALNVFCWTAQQRGYKHFGLTDTSLHKC